MNAVSLFAGVGGFDLALERAGVPVVAAVEIDKQASGVLAHRFPNTKLFGDIQEVTGNDLRGAGFVPERGIITGGFPCQDLSVAGKRAGLAGERSGLFWEIVRLIDDLHPKWFVLENVPGLLSSNGGRDMGIVLGTLAECGYGVAYRVLDAQNFGVPQRRRRVFIVGCLGDNGRAPSEVLALTESLRGDLEASQSSGQTPSGKVGSSTESRQPVGTLTTAGFRCDLNKAVSGHIVFYGNRVNDVRIQDDKINTLQARMGTGGNNMPLVLGYGQTGFAKYTEGQVKTLAATDYKRAEDNLVVGQITTGAE
jgi:DNA (cytosine-5)-methyltransferase 1